MLAAFFSPVVTVAGVFVGAVAVGDCVGVHTEVFGDPGVRFAEPVQSGDEIAHEINIMRSPRPVVPYRGKLYILIRIMYVL